MIATTKASNTLGTPTLMPMMSPACHARDQTKAIDIGRTKNGVKGIKERWKKKQGGPSSMERLKKGKNLHQPGAVEDGRCSCSTHQRLISCCPSLEQEEQSAKINKNQKAFDVKG